MISIPLSYLSEKISEVLSQSAHHTNVIRLSLKAQFKAQIRCPYCGGKIRKFGFYPKQIFDAVTGTFRTLLIQRCQSGLWQNPSNPPSLNFNLIQRNFKHIGTKIPVKFLKLFVAICSRIWYNRDMVFLTLGDCYETYYLSF